MLSVLIVTLTMTAPMTAWMLYALGWLGILPLGDLALLEHGLMMPVMLVPMLVRLDLYTGRVDHATGRAR